MGSSHTDEGVLMKFINKIWKNFQLFVWYMQQRVYLLHDFLIFSGRHETKHEKSKDGLFFEIQTLANVPWGKISLLLNSDG